MDIEEARNFAISKIKTDSLAQYVKDKIKKTNWKKQDYWEGFKEAYKPFFLSQDSIKKSIDQQQDATIAQLQANQLALTEALRANRFAITDRLRDNQLAFREGLREGFRDNQLAFTQGLEGIRNNQLDLAEGILDNQLTFTEGLEGLRNNQFNLTQGFDGFRDNQRAFTDELRDNQRAFTDELRDNQHAFRDNQLAFTDELRDNQRAFREGLRDGLREGLRDNQNAFAEELRENLERMNENILRLNEMREGESLTEEPITNTEINLNEDELETLINMGYPRPNEFSFFKTKELKNKIQSDVNKNIEKIFELSRISPRTQDEEEELKAAQEEENLLYKYKKVVNNYLRSFGFKNYYYGFNFDDEDMEILFNMGYISPHNIYGSPPEIIKELSNKVDKDLLSIYDQRNEILRKENKTEDDNKEINAFTILSDLLIKYSKILNIYLDTAEKYIAVLANR